MLNQIFNNVKFGVHTIAKNGLRHDGVIKYNEIEKNKENGIVCTGMENHTRIEKNHLIAHNRLAGIKVEKGATVKILNNKIHENFSQGILLVDGTDAFITKNKIFSNYKANIAFGGDGSGDTKIYDNDIFSSRQEGIFCVEGQFSWI